jgi:uncharacterized protein (TIGR00290 family)
LERLVEFANAMTANVLFCWSGGKDSAMALYEFQRAGCARVMGLLTTVTEGYDRISMHGVRRVLLEQQADALRLPLHIVSIPPKCANVDYEARMGEALAQQQQNGISAVAFGDIFLKDLRVYREEKLAPTGLRALFPIWKRDTRELARTFIQLGFRAITVCVDPRVLDASFIGQEINDAFLQRLPAAADPCGENGEFHLFVYAGPIFHHPIGFTRGKVVQRDGFCFCDLLPANTNQHAATASE